MEEIDLLVVGNGFDIAHNLLTKYEHFYKFMQISVDATSRGDFFRKIQDVFKITITPRIMNKGLQFLGKKIHSLKENFFVKYFTNYKKIYDTWNALESELKEILIAFDYMFDNLKFDNYQGSGAFEIPNIDSQHGQYAIYKKDIIGKWLTININALDNYTKGWVVFSSYPDYDRIEIEIFLKKIKGKMIEQLYLNFKEFTYLFETYLNIFAEPELLYYNSDFKFKKILSYNYTRNASKVFKISENDCFYIHGKYNPIEFVNKLLNDDIIFGIDDYTFLNPRFEIFTKSDQRTKLPDKRKIYSFIEGVQSVCFYGHSFDLLDTQSLRMICDNVPKIYIFYHDNYSLTSIKYNLRKIVSKKNIDDEIERCNIVFRHTSEMHFFH